MSADPPRIVPWPPWLGLVVVMVMSGMGFADLAWAGMASPAFEELLNARAALLTACGHVLELPALQYRAFCGGCSADALIGAGPMRLLGASVWTWKLVPVGLHAIASGALVVLAGAGGGRRAAVVAFALLAGAPSAWRELVLTGWGNHAESMAFTFGAAALLLPVGRRPWVALLSGVVAGLGLWYAWISAHALPALAGAALLGGGWRALVAFGLGVPLGVAPLVGFLVVRPEAVPETAALWSRVDLASPPAWLSWWLEPLLPGRSWAHGDGVLQWLGAAATGTLTLLGLAGAIVGARRSRDDATRIPGLLVLGGLLGLGVATFVRQDLWADNPALMGFDPFALRYRSPALPLVLLGAALVAGRSRGAAVAAVVVAAFGLHQRVVGWSTGPGQDLGRPLLVVAIAADPTVPEGVPPRRKPARMSRPQDIEAAEAMLREHPDPLPACRAVHAGELGRRMGIRDADAGCSSWTAEGPDAPALSLGHASGCSR